MIWYTTEFAVSENNEQKKNCTIVLSCTPLYSIGSSDSEKKGTLFSFLNICFISCFSSVHLRKSSLLYGCCILYCMCTSAIRSTEMKGERERNLYWQYRQYEKYTQHNSCKMCVRVLKEQGKTRKNL